VGSQKEKQPDAADKHTLKRLLSVFTLIQFSLIVEKS